MHLKFNRKAVKNLNLRKKSKPIKKPKPTPRRVIGGIKLAVIALCVLLGLFVLSKSISGFTSLFQPIDSNIAERGYSLDFETSVNIVFKSQNVWVLNYDPNKKQAILLKIPDDTLIEVSKGYGLWLVGSIYDLGQEENPKIGGELLKDSLSNLLGLPIDGVIVGGEESDDLEKIVFGFKISPLKLISFFSQYKTDLSPLEVLKLYQAISKTREDKIVNLDLENTELTQSLLLPDSTRVLGFDSVNIDLFVRENMFDEVLSTESKTIAIYNGTDHPGLGSKVSRIITNLGADAVILTNAEKKLQKTVILGDKESESFKKIALTFAPYCLKEDCASDDLKVISSRADISIVLGEDYFEKNEAR